MCWRHVFPTLIHLRKAVCFVGVFCIAAGKGWFLTGHKFGSGLFSYSSIGRGNWEKFYNTTHGCMSGEFRSGRRLYGPREVLIYLFWSCITYFMSLKQRIKFILFIFLVRFFRYEMRFFPFLFLLRTQLSRSVLCCLEEFLRITLKVMTGNRYVLVLLLA